MEFVGSSQPTYEELKPSRDMGSKKEGPCSQPTYEELKPQSCISAKLTSLRVLSLPMRN